MTAAGDAVVERAEHIRAGGVFLQLARGDRPVEVGLGAKDLLVREVELADVDANLREGPGRLARAPALRKLLLVGEVVPAMRVLLRAEDVRDGVVIGLTVAAKGLVDNCGRSVGDELQPRSDTIADDANGREHAWPGPKWKSPLWFLECSQRADLYAARASRL